MTSTKKLGSAGLAAALAAGSLAALAAAGPASAATTGTGAIQGQSANTLGTVWYDDAAQPKPGTNGGTARTVELTAVADGPDIDYTIKLSQGPQNSFNPLAAGTYSLDPQLRLDGAAGTRGDRHQGPTGPAVAGGPVGTGGAVVFPGGVTIEGTIPRAGVGTHKVTLTDLVLNVTSTDDGAPEGNKLSDPYGGFDTFYNPSATAFATPTDWALSETVTVTDAPPVDKVKPKLKVKKPAKKKAKKGNAWKVVKGTTSDALSGPDEVRVELTSKTSTGWKFFNGKKYKAAKNKKVATKKAKKKALVATPALNGKWSVEPGVKAPKGKLTVKVTAFDKDGNKRVKKLKQKIKK